MFIPRGRMTELLKQLRDVTAARDALDLTLAKERAAHEQSLAAAEAAAVILRTDGDRLRSQLADARSSAAKARNGHGGFL